MYIALCRSQFLLMFWINSINEIPPCHHLSPSGKISHGLFLPLLSLIFPVIMMFMIWSKNDVCSFLTAAYRIPLSLAIYRQLLFGNCTLVFALSQKPHFHCLQVFNLFIHIPIYFTKRCYFKINKIFIFFFSWDYLWQTYSTEGIFTSSSRVWIHIWCIL